MIIGIDASCANDDQKTGEGWYAYHTIQQFKRLSVGQPVKVVLYSKDNLKGDLADLPDNWESKVLHWSPFGFTQGRPLRLWTQIRLSWEMLFHAPDVLFIPAHTFPIIHPKKTVMTIHDIAATKFPKSYNWFERWYTVFRAKWAISGLWKIIVPSQFTANELASLQVRKPVPTGHPPSGINKINVVHHGYDERYGKNIEDIKKILKKYLITEPYLFSVGRLEEKKNTVRIIKAFENLRLNIYDLQLVLVSSKGYGYEKVKQVIENSPFKKDIITPGWVDNDDLPALMQGAEVFVFPSLYEGFGIPVLEAFASGTPVVASLGGALKEVGGNACEYVDKLDVVDITRGIEKILHNDEYRMLNIEKGKKRVEEFSWEKCARETWDILRSETSEEGC